MASESVLNLELLLAPIDGENPVGTDIRKSSSATSIYYKIKDARGGARTSERQLLAEGDPDKANVIAPEWVTVMKTADEILATHSKDLEVAAWYTEGLLRHYGLPGLRDGFRLITGLVEKYWDEIYPLPDEDGLETRISSLIGLNGVEGEGALIVPMNKVALTEENTFPPFAAWHYEQAIELEKITDPKKKDARISSGSVSLQMIQQAVSETPASYYNDLHQDASACIEAFSQMTAALDQRCKKESPPSSNISNKLKRLKQVIGFLSKEPSQDANDAKAKAKGKTDASNSAGATVSGTSSAATGNGAIMNREDAHRSLLEVAKYFRETEPHSPVPYMLEQAVRWGNLSLPELLAELITDDRARQDYFKMTGIPIKDKKSKPPRE